MFDAVERAWVEFGREGKPRLICGCYYAVGPDADADMAAYVGDYYPAIFDAPIEPLIASMNCVRPDAIKYVVTQFEAIGCDEFVFQPVKPDIAQLHGLADLVM